MKAKSERTRKKDKSLRNAIEKLTFPPEAPKLTI